MSNTLLKSSISIEIFKIAVSKKIAGTIGSTAKSCENSNLGAFKQSGAELVVIQLGVGTPHPGCVRPGKSYPTLVSDTQP